MPLNYASETPIASTLIKNVDCVDIVIHVPRNGNRTVLFRYESTNASGVFVERRELTVPVNDPDLISDLGYTTVSDTLKRLAYKLAVRAGYPAGGTVQ